MSETVEEIAYKLANDLADKKERAIERAIKHYFNGEPWDENILQRKASVTYLGSGAEIFVIDDIRMIYFEPIKTKVEIHDNRAVCLFSQEIKELY